MARFIQAEVNLSALQDNFQLLCRQLSSARIICTVKANGYGHGALAVARALPDADMFGVACINEALELRNGGVLQTILLFEGFFEAKEIHDAVQYDFEVVVHSRQQVAMLLAAKIPRPLTVWLKLDTGMHRLGFAAQEVSAAYRDLSASRNVNVIRLMSHFACADDLTSDFTEQQIALFQEVSADLIGEVSLANSAGLLAWPQSQADWVRPGLALYGCSPFAVAHKVADQLRPVMTLSSRIIAVHHVKAGEGVGYGQDWHAAVDSIIATVAVGYGDGYPRHARSGTPVLVNGLRSSVVGRVSMDMITVDVTLMPAVQIGDPVVLWGAGLSANEVAKYCDTIAYELLTGINRRVPLHYCWHSATI